VQASSMLVAQLLGDASAAVAAAAPVQQFSSLQLGLVAWSLAKLVDVNSQVRNGQMHQLVDVVALHAGNSRVMDQPADEACRHWSRLIYGVSASGILCKDSHAVQQLFKVAAQRLPEMLRRDQHCVPQDASNAIWAFATAEHTGSLQHLVAEIAGNLGVMQGAKPQVGSYASRPEVQHVNLKMPVHF